jgi:hypothetical protein
MMGKKADDTSKDGVVI